MKQSAGADIELPELPGGGLWMRRLNMPVLAVLSIALLFAGKCFYCSHGRNLG